jgi:hypothetical protein
VKRSKRLHGRTIVEQTRQAAREGRWRDAGAKTRALARHYPRGLVLLVVGAGRKKPIS